MECLMRTAQEKQHHPIAREGLNKQGSTTSPSQLQDLRSETISQRKIQSFAMSSGQVRQLQAIQEMIDLAGNVKFPAQLYPGGNFIRKLKAKCRKKKRGAQSAVKGMLKGRGIRTRYQEFDAPTEQDHYDDILDEEAEDYQRNIDFPIANRVRTYGLGPVKKVAKEGADALGNLVPIAGPIVGKGAKKLVGMGLDTLDKKAKKKMTTGMAYKVLRDPKEEGEE